MEPTAGRRRRLSKELPPELSDLLDTLTDHATSYIKAFNSKEKGMRQIVEELNVIAAEVKEMQKNRNTARMTGVALAGVGLAALFTGGLALLPAVAAAAGGGAVVATNVSKTIIENGSAKKAETLGKEFMEIIEPLKERLQKMQTLFQELEERSAAVQTEASKFERILKEMFELRKLTETTLSGVTVLSDVIGNLLMLIVMIFRVTATPEEDKKLTDSIIQSADQSQRVIDAFQRMSQELEKQINKEKMKQAEKSSNSD